MIVDDGGDATLLIHEGVKAEKEFLANGTLPDPNSSTNPDYKCVLNLLRAFLVFVPVSLWLGMSHASPTWVFLTSCLAVLPLAGLMGEATEHLSHRTGPGIGGLLNATFGNITELIISVLLIAAGEFTVVKASLIGSILGNLFLVMGGSILAGGLRYPEQSFSIRSAGVHAR